MAKRMGPHPIDPMVRFESLTTTVPEIPCAIWTGSLTERGYGQFFDGRRQTRAHRWIWKQRNGPIPTGLQVCHHCDIRCCVNVDRCLYLGPPWRNSLDMVERGRSTFGERNPQAILTWDAVRAMRSSGLKAATLAPMYGVNIYTVYDVLSGRTWKHGHEDTPVS